jgi:hypothetical protein
VKTLVEQADSNTRKEIEALLADASVEKPIHEEVTYGEINEQGNNLWNFLFFTGYLTQGGSRQDGTDIQVSMKIPNMEISHIYKNTIISWFENKIKQRDLTALYNALFSGDTDTAELELADILMQSISYHDYSESYYHGFLLGLVRGMQDMIVMSNRESGLGRPDLIIKPRRLNETVLIIEIKVADSYAGMEDKCEEALKQIADQQYEEGPRSEGFRSFVHYGIAFYKKSCMVRKRA